MKWLLLILASICTWFAYGQQLDVEYPKYNATQLQQDFDTLYQALRDNHPDLYAYWKKEAADKTFAKSRKQLDRPMTRQEFAITILPFVAKFKDGHSFLSVFDTEEMEQYLKAGGKIFPLRVAFINNRLYCSDVSFSHSKLKPGQEILAINGVPGATIIKQSIEIWSADGEANAVATAQRLFSFGLWLRYNWGTLTEVTYLSDKGKVSEKVEGLPKDQYNDFIYNTSNARQLHLYKDVSLAVVEIRAYNNLQRSKTFIDSAFKVIKENNIQHVALDLRKNGGGNSYIGDYFLGYINRKPYRTIASKRWRLGPLVASLPTDHWMRNSLNSAKEKWVATEAFLQSPVFDDQQPVMINDSNYYSNARFYLLTSARTYSSAHMTAMAVKCANLGIIIGQPTGERLNLTGEILEKTLPCTKLKMVIPSASYISSCGNGKQVGVAPDHYVPISASDIKFNKDPELDYLRALIHSKN